MAYTMTQSGQAAIAEAVKLSGIGLMIGTGEVSWGQEPPPVSDGATALISPLGFIRPRGIFFAYPDENGILETVEGNWSTSLVPTKWLYMEFALDYHDGGDSVIREMSFYINTTFSDSVPIAQEFITINSVDNVGSLLAIQRKAPIELHNTKVVFKEVISF